MEYNVKVIIGTTRWYINGNLHREDGPAIEYQNGGKQWYINGKLHREDGPAFESPSGDKFWYLDGKQVTESDVINKKNYTVKELEAIVGHRINVISGE